MSALRLSARNHLVTSLLCTILFISSTSCDRKTRLPALPSTSVIHRESLVIHTDVDLPSQHRLVDALVLLRYDLQDTLGLESSDDLVHVYLFADQSSYEDYLGFTHPTLPDRRAFFVKEGDMLKVYGYWGDRVAIDLRHEVTHGYIHACVPDIPLWLDEGIAEYFEVTNGQRGLNESHLRLLNSRLASRSWSPDLARLESLEHPSEMLQIDYAEAWMWVYWMLQTEERSAQLRDYLAALQHRTSPVPLKDRFPPSPNLQQSVESFVANTAILLDEYQRLNDTRR